MKGRDRNGSACGSTHATQNGMVGETRFAEANARQSSKLSAGVETPLSPRVSQPDLLAATLSQREHAELRSLEFDRCLIALIRNGTKAVRDTGRELVAREGDVVVIPSFRAVDVINSPSMSACPPVYRASVLFVPDPWDIRSAPEQTLVPLGGVEVVHSPCEELAVAFDRALAAATDEQSPACIVAHRALEVVLWVETLIGKRLSGTAAGRLNAARQVRRLVASAPAASWDAKTIARSLAMSEATLRRRLRRERTTIADLVRETRMLRALELLQGASHGISDVAAAVGYESPSRFAERFRERFGVPPSVFRRESGV